MKILITGGHVTTALGIIEELKKHTAIEIIFVGRKYTDREKKILSFEYEALINLKIRFIPIETGRLTRLFALRTLIDCLQFPLGLLRFWHIVRKEKPDVILSCGGYIALPIAINAFFLRIPLFTHEQTMTPGITNRSIAYFAERIFVSFPESVRFFTKRKTVITGNPLRNSIFKIMKRPFNIHKTKPVIYVTGGSLGSHSINRIIEDILPFLLKQYIIIHQTGNVMQYGDFERLSRHQSENYFLCAHFPSEEIGFIYSIADMVIARSGANTIFELIALQKPAILIPLPWSAGGEQKAHALFLQKKGTAEVFFQEKEKSKIVLSLIAKILHNRKTYIKNYSTIKHYYRKNASKTIVHYILSQK